MNLPSELPRGNLAKHQSRNPLQRLLIGHFHREIGSLVQAAHPENLCEIGCGEGFVLKEIVENKIVKAQNILGVDIDPSSLDYAKKNLPRVAFHCGSVHRLPFKDKSWDMILLLEVLEHLEDPEHALQEVRRVSRKLVVSVPHEPFFMLANFLRGKNIFQGGNDPEHIQHWNACSFKKMLSSYGTIKAFRTPFPWLAVSLEFND